MYASRLAPAIALKRISGKGLDSPSLALSKGVLFVISLRGVVLLNFDAEWAGAIYVLFGLSIPNGNP